MVASTPLLIKMSLFENFLIVYVKTALKTLFLVFFNLVSDHHPLKIFKTKFDDGTGQVD
jgi:hypothetical protein